jgi:SAM-dependent methyltransferase
MTEFDQVAPVYDATRPPPTTAEIEAVRQALRPARSVFEAGVGTGRYASVLAAEGLEVTGADIAIEMLRRARAKGLRRLARADLHHLPWRDGAFDAALMVHVLQLIPDPFAALAELLRVARDRAVVVIPERTAGQLERPGRLLEAYRASARRRGIEIPPRLRYWENGDRLLAGLPPSELTRVEGRPRSADRRRSWEELRSFGGFVAVPEAVHREIVAELRAQPQWAQSTPPLGGRTLIVAVWTAPQRPAVEERARAETDTLKDRKGLPSPGAAP